MNSIINIVYVFFKYLEQYIKNQYYPGSGNVYPYNNPYNNNNAQLDENGNPIRLNNGAVPSSTNILDQPGYVYDYSKVVERHFNFVSIFTIIPIYVYVLTYKCEIIFYLTIQDEEYPFWMTKPDPYDTYHYGGANELPYLRFVCSFSSLFVYII